MNSLLSIIHKKGLDLTGRRLLGLMLGDASADAKHLLISVLLLFNLFSRLFTFLVSDSE
jgi:hypothetical protein